MAVKKLRLRIATPESVKFDDDTDMVIMRCITGDMGILPNHQPISAILDFGVLRIITGELEKRMAVFGGIAQVVDNVVTILANDAQWPEDIDIAFVQSERARMERRSQEDLDDLEIQRDQVLMRRTLVQIEVSSYPILSRTEPEEP
ncbi:MAG: ATP synthase F1 subunit epsilon [Oscillospiraceae bacterium]|nr:ATP synthase F1 subunit epsilon [Oscillospiraceae bacterium]